MESLSPVWRGPVASCLACNSPPASGRKERMSGPLRREAPPAKKPRLSLLVREGGALAWPRPRDTADGRQQSGLSYSTSPQRCEAATLSEFAQRFGKILQIAGHGEGLRN